MKEIIFSPTGGTRKVADALCKGLGEDASVIDLIAAEWMYHPYHFEMYQS